MIISMKYKAYKKKFDEKYEGFILKEHFADYKFARYLINRTHLAIQKSKWEFKEEIFEKDEGMSFNLKLIDAPKAIANEYRSNQLQKYSTYKDLLGLIIVSVHLKIKAIKKWYGTKNVLEMEVRASDMLFSLFTDDKAKIEALTISLAEKFKKEIGIDVETKVMFVD